MKLYQIAAQITITDPDVFKLYNPNDNTDLIYTAADVTSALDHYGLRYTTKQLSVVWLTFVNLFWQSYYKNLEMLNSDIDPLTNYDYTETRTETIDNGDTTKTRDTDTTKNYVETTIDTDVSKTVSAGTGTNQPRTDVYNVCYDTVPKHSGYTTQSGETTERTTTQANGNKSRTTDNLKITNTETHSTITKTVNGETLTADEIRGTKIEKHGTQNIDKLDMIKRAIEINKISVLNDFIMHFVDKYSIYVGGDEIDLEFI